MSLRFLSLLLVFLARPEAITAQVLTRDEVTVAPCFPSELPGGSFQTVEAFEGLRFRRPVAIAREPGDRHRLYIVEQEGTIRILPDLNAPTSEIFLDLSDQTWFQGESGLLGLAFHPRYEENGFFYVFYTTRIDRRNYQRVARFQRSSTNPDRADAGSEVPMIDQLDEASNHNGGDLHFGPDGYLYISVGDEGGANDAFDNARFIDKDFHGGILRIDVDRLPGSMAPNDHPGVHPGT
ncbi:MAG: PQQ-dependent sugar dehydrogenase, partial [Verrucomicrobiota bacterium]